MKGSLNKSVRKDMVTGYLGGNKISVPSREKVKRECHRKRKSERRDRERDREREIEIER